MCQFADILVAGGHDHGRATIAGVAQQADGVGQPCFDMKIQEGRQTGQAPVSIGHSDPHTLLGDQDVFQVVELLQGLHHGAFARARVPDDVADALSSEHLHHRPLTRHQTHLPLAPLIRSIAATDKRCFRTQGQGFAGVSRLPLARKQSTSLFSLDNRRSLTPYR